MIKVTQAAQDFLGQVLREQDIANLHLKVVVMHSGTPAADCHLDFCEVVEVQDGYNCYEQNDFNLYVNQQDEPHLEDAVIDYEIKDASGQLNINAPLLKGAEPDETVGLFERVQYFLDAEINPMLAAHGGYANVSEIKGDTAFILFGGGCHGCGMAKQTLSSGMQSQIIDKFSEINHVVDATNHATGDNPYY